MNNTEKRLLNEWFYIVYDEHSADYTSNLHSHNSYEMFIIVSGGSNMLIDDHLTNMGKNNIALIKPDYLHKNNGGVKHCRYALHFTENYLKTYFTKDTVNSLTNIFNNNILKLKQPVFNKVLDLLRCIYAGDQFSYIHIAEIISLLSVRENLDYQSGSSGGIVNSILEYINQNYSDISTLDDISDALHISKPYMCNAFKKETTITISQYLNGTRINNACELLKKSGANITETAFMCGFSSSMYFCRIFKSIVGMTPTEYRKHTANE